MPEQRDRVKAYIPKEAISKAPESTVKLGGEPFDPQKGAESAIKRLEKSTGLSNNIDMMKLYLQKLRIL